ncbi:MAG: hypothetical protein AMXMBFR20_03960 [Planctomycetia bacterium]
MFSNCAGAGHNPGPEGQRWLPVGFEPLVSEPNHTLLFFLPPGRVDEGWSSRFVRPPDGKDLGRQGPVIEITGNHRAPCRANTSAIISIHYRANAQIECAHPDEKNLSARSVFAVNCE